LEPGGTDRSYGIHVAQLAGLPAAVVRRALEVLGTLEGEHRVVSGPTPPPADPEQLDLLGHAALPHPLLERLRELDLDSLTPIQALVRLSELQQEARG
jgi:DNA mismatch repair protein MutS